MKTFKQYIEEARDKSDPHESTIRKLATLGRLDWKYHGDYAAKEIDDHPDKKSEMSGRTHYGECDSISHCVANRLRHLYPSVKVVYSHNFGQSYPGEESLTGHSWVEIPETGHFVDPSHDMFRIQGTRTNIPIRGGLFPNSAIKIGIIGDPYHRQNYSQGVKRDPNWNPGQKPWEIKWWKIDS